VPHDHWKRLALAALLIGKLIRTFAPAQCTNYFRHGGYA